MFIAEVGREKCWALAANCGSLELGLLDRGEKASGDYSGLGWGSLVIQQRLTGVLFCFVLFFTLSNENLLKDLKIYR